MKRLLILTILALSCMGIRAEQLTDSVRVHFRVNQTVIDSLLMGNDAAMRGFAQRMQALSSNDTVNVAVNSILITGAASPEGSIAINEHLSRERAAAITRWLQGYFEFPDTLPQFVFKGRDWQGLLSMVENDPKVPYRREVIDVLTDIVGTHPGASASASASPKAKRDGVARLKALRRGVPYYYMWKNLFPALRASEIFINAIVTPIPRIEPVDTCRDATCRVRTDEARDTIASIVETIAIISDSIADADATCRVPTSGGYVFGLKTNGIYDLALIPNIGVEFPIGKHLSVGANWMYAWWKNHDRNRHWRIYGGDINARWYFGGGRDVSRPYTGHHVGVYGQVLLFQIAFGGKGYITGIPGENLWGKPYLGGGIEYGYSKRIGKRLNIDFSLGLGYMAGEYRVYRPIDDHYVWQSTHRRNWFGPTKAEISLVWLIGKMPKVGTHPGASALEKGGGYE